ncbi:MAG: GTPase HflX [Cryomorphaceae bacterium BACL11 MAG-121015-bin20]|jgi:GTPase|nr:MAG: GTPase HflX [Cryomorphaceae bacterium BACL11 MAG-121015-bin20]
MERAVLVGLITPDVTHDQAYEYLAELAFLAKTAGAEPLRNFTQRLPHPDNKTFIGKGKIEEVKLYVEENEIEAIIFDDDLTPSQIRNLESLFEGGCKILDRSSLILDIFASRAQTAQARTQVELAQYQYLLPRLTRMWTHLERQKGGIGMRGPGETQIETDRQIVRDKIALLKQKLQKIDKQSSTRRKGREHLIRVALVGYTNAGKSTLMNKLAKSEVFVENKLFATLDTTVRKVVIENLPFLLTDTVGFIRKLPHQLVESFKSTLDEVREADFMIHVVDISNPNFEDHIDVVNKTLAELGVNDKPMLLVFNKIDAYTFIEKEEDDLTPSSKENLSLKDLQKTWMSKIEGNAMFISALNKTHFDDLKDEIYSRIKQLHEIKYPYNNFLY